MAWFEGTATDYKDLLAKLKEYATSDNVQSVASIDAAGSGFSEGDLVDVSGGTSTTGAQLEVVSVSSGQVTEIRVYNGGAYSVLPSTTQTGLTSAGGGSGLNVTLTTQAATHTARIDRSAYRPIDVVVNAGGSGYSDDQIVTLSPGAATQLRPTLIEIDDAVSGAASTISIEQRGIYDAIPGATGVATTGGGSGFTVDVTWQEEKELVLESDEGAFVGIRTYSAFDGTPYFNWELAGMQGFSAASEWAAQPSLSRGRYDDDVNIGGAFVPLRNVSMQFWVTIRANRIMFWILVGSNVSSGFLGLLDATSTPGLAAGLYPYPLLVAGCSTDPFAIATESVITSFSGFHDPVTIGFTSSSAYRNEYSCMQLNSPGNNWLDIRNSVTQSSSDGGTSRVQVTDRIVWPMGNSPSLVSGSDLWPTEPSGVSTNDFTTRTLSAPSSNLIPTPGASGDEYLVVPLTIISNFSPEFIAGQIPDAFWVSAENGIADSGNVIKAGGDRYRIFQSGRYSDAAQFVAVLEA